ncbi:DUF4253 domain-containing protein [Actinomadura sp. GC306]|uniref:DUF4253 domain-containing protein n=1 Tax=Actinomadura sp. GC306 TaxID=2530367 RepID=UPI00104DDAA2|nr:DUF4253 domain-containing protein [Actinomadura sp. GC306]TDC62692.1 DUF4253 domain-containing protein [Actinomadura sp. GC306]
MSDRELLPAELANLVKGGAGARTLAVSLPAGRIVDTDDGPPGLWMTDEAVAPGLWAAVHAEHPRSGLWPVLLDALDDPSGDGGEFRPWDSGELTLEGVTSPDRHDPAVVLADWWHDYAQSDDTTAPFLDWPGLAPARPFADDAGAIACEYATRLLRRSPAMRLGLIAADRSADALAAAGWTGPLNYTNDTGEIASVLRSWEGRFGVRVVGAGFADLYLSVAAPPATLEEAIHLAAEHFAFCPDNIWQNSHPHTLLGYAENLVGCTSWSFWWD